MVDLGKNFKSIRPSKSGDISKYNPQIYRFLMKNREFFGNEIPKVLFLFYKEDKLIPVIDLDYVKGVFANNEWSSSNIMIAKQIMHDGDILGIHLSSVIGRNPSYSTGCYVGMNRYIVLDITEWFWNEYLRIGICLFTKGHGEEDPRFINKNKKQRVCRFCGLEQKLIIKTVKHTTKNWVNILDGEEQCIIPN